MLPTHIFKFECLTNSQIPHSHYKRKSLYIFASHLLIHNQTIIYLHLLSKTLSPFSLYSSILLFFSQFSRQHPHSFQDKIFPPALFNNSMAEKELDLNLMATEEEELTPLKKEGVHLIPVMIEEERHLIQVMTVEEEEHLTRVTRIEEQQRLIQVTTEEKIDLNLSLRCGGSKMIESVSFKETPTPYLFLPPVNPYQTNVSLMKMQMFSPNPNPNPNVIIDPNPSMASFFKNNNNSVSLASSSHNTDPPNAANPPNAEKTVSAAKGSVRRSRRTSSGRRCKKVRKTVPEPFPWATNKRATVHSQQYLLENNVRTIKGKIHCKKCDKDFELGLDLEEKLGELCKLIEKKNGFWHNRAPAGWLNPVFPKCAFCGRQTTTRPIIEKNKKEINWLFLFLGQMLGCCTLDHLKYFCKHNDIHRTGAKDRLLYLTYTNLVKQLVPDFSNS